MRPTRRMVLVALAATMTSAALVVTSAALWPVGAALPALVLFLLGLDGALAPGRRQLHVRTRTPAILYIGAGDSLEVALGNGGRGPATAGALLVEAGAPLARPEPVAFLLAPGGTTTLSVPLIPRRRGEAAVSAVWLRWCGPLGLMARQVRLAIDEVVPVVPNVRAVRTLALHYATREMLFGIKPQRQQGDGSAFEALRDYVPGLDHRAIDWKHSARHRTLVCKEFEAERNHQIVFAFDTGRLMSAPIDGIPKLDHAINAALMMIYMSLRAGDRVGLCGFDAQMRLFAEPVGGTQAFNGIQRQLARLDYAVTETNYTLSLMQLLNRLTRRTLVVVMTDFVDTITAELMLENLERLASRHLVLFVGLQEPDLSRTVDAFPEDFATAARAVIAGDIIHDRRVVFERLRRLGVLCVEAAPDRLAIDMINRYLLIKREERI